MLSHEVVAILRCPEDGAPLKPASDALIARLNAMIQSHHLRNRGGRFVESSLNGGLLNASADILYPIIEGIPVLVREEGIPLGQVDGAALDNNGV